MFFSTATTVFNAVFQLFLISCAAGFLVRKKVISQPHIQGVSGTIVAVFLPCLILSKVIHQFDPSAFKLWWTLPLGGVAIMVLGLVLSAVLFQAKPDKRQLFPLASMQNVVYIPLPIAQIIYPDQFDTFALYAFLIVLGITPLMWSVGKVLISGNKETDFKWKELITPPFIAILIAFFIVFTGLSDLIPGPVMASIDLLGQATVPLAIFILGATLGSIRLTEWPPVKDTVLINLVKSILVPGSVFAVLYLAGLRETMPIFCSMMIIQAAAPPATNLILMVKNYGGDDQTIGSMMLIQHLVCILAIPFWLSLWESIIQ